MDQKLDTDRPGLLEEAVFRPHDARRGRLLLKREPGTLSAALVQRVPGAVLGKVLVGAVGSQHVGRAHAGDAAVIAKA